jgi:hypothetical protein
LRMAAVRFADRPSSSARIGRRAPGPPCGSTSTAARLFAPPAGSPPLEGGGPGPRDAADGLPRTAPRAAAHERCGGFHARGPNAIPAPSKAAAARVRLEAAADDGAQSGVPAVDRAPSAPARHRAGPMLLTKVWPPAPGKRLFFRRTCFTNLRRVSILFVRAASSSPGALASPDADIADVRPGRCRRTHSQPIGLREIDRLQNPFPLPFKPTTLMRVALLDSMAIQGRHQ